MGERANKGTHHFLNVAFRSGLDRRKVGWGAVDVPSLSGFVCVVGIAGEEDLS